MTLIKLPKYTQGIAWVATLEQSAKPKPGHCVETALGLMQALYQVPRAKLERDIARERVALGLVQGLAAGLRPIEQVEAQVQEPSYAPAPKGSTRELIQIALAARGYRLLDKATPDGSAVWHCDGNCPTRLGDSLVFVWVNARSIRAGRSYNRAQVLAEATRKGLIGEGQILAALGPSAKPAPLQFANSTAQELGL